jgi:hypothetical protein
MFVIMRNDGKHVARPGSMPSYTERLEDAAVYPTAQSAEKDLCVENEHMVAANSIIKVNIKR